MVIDGARIRGEHHYFFIYIFLVMYCFHMYSYVLHILPFALVIRQKVSEAVGIMCQKAYARAKRVVQLLRTWPQNAEEEPSMPCFFKPVMGGRSR